jgi:transcriptional regulator with XRE-family HTH domain
MYPNLKLQLWRLGIRQNRLAQMLGMHESLLSKMINGYREPGPEIRAKIAALLNSDELWLFEQTPASGSSEIQTLGDKPALGIPS